MLCFHLVWDQRRTDTSARDHSLALQVSPGTKIPGLPPRCRTTPPAAFPWPQGLAQSHQLRPIQRRHLEASLAIPRHVALAGLLGLQVFRELQGVGNDHLHHLATRRQEKKWVRLKIQEVGLRRVDLWLHLPRCHFGTPLKKWNDFGLNHPRRRKTPPSAQAAGAHPGQSRRIGVVPCRGRRASAKDKKERIKKSKAKPTSRLLPVLFGGALGPNA